MAVGDGVRVNLGHRLVQPWGGLAGHSTDGGFRLGFGAYGIGRGGVRSEAEG